MCLRGKALLLYRGQGVLDAHKSCSEHLFASVEFRLLGVSCHFSQCTPERANITGSTGKGPRGGPAFWFRAYGMIRALFSAGALWQAPARRVLSWWRPLASADGSRTSGAVRGSASRAALCAGGCCRVGRTRARPGATRGRARRAPTRAPSPAPAAESLSGAGAPSGASPAARSAPGPFPADATSARWSAIAGCARGAPCLGAASAPAARRATRASPATSLRCPAGPPARSP